MPVLREWLARRGRWPHRPDPHRPQPRCRTRHTARHGACPEPAGTFGSPRVGSTAFVAALAEVQLLRLVNGCDLVTHLPPALSLFANARFG
ncbi:lipase family protein [Variovorax sp. PBL-H6]|uniref:lipase family protein n=1 Tax=Variovorax sp. PBL-H6 TaxID=434009 RepID=UPI003FCEC19B